jgi:hypothetical protein
MYSDTEIKVHLTNTTKHYYFDITIGKEVFRLGYDGGLIESKAGLYFLATNYHGITEPQRLFKLDEVEINITVNESEES